MRNEGTRAAGDVAVQVAFVVLLIAGAIGGGASRPDVPLLVLVRMFAVICGALALVYMPWERLRPVRTLLILLGLFAALMMLQLIPLPPALWTALPARDVLTEMAAAIGADATWRPLSIAPIRTWNSLVSLIVPIGMLLVLALLPDRRRLLPLYGLLGLGLLSSFLGLLQIIGPERSPLYLYEFTYPGSAVGFFSNRNHQAVLLVCLLPLLGVFAVLARPDRPMLGRVFAIVCCGVYLLPMLLITGSRAALLLLPVGASLALWISFPVFRRLRLGRVGWIGAIIAALALVVSIGAAIVNARALALDRLMATDALGERRFEVLAPAWDMARSYLPFGSGFGTFDLAFRMIEPERVLTRSYLNHAHMELLELFSDGGLPAILLFGAFIFWWGRAAACALMQPASMNAALARGGVALSSIIMLGSLVDYPLRSPLMMLVFIIALYWMAVGVRVKIDGKPDNSSDKSASQS